MNRAAKPFGGMAERGTTTLTVSRTVSPSCGRTRLNPAARAGVPPANARPISATVSPDPPTTLFISILSWDYLLTLLVLTGLPGGLAELLHADADRAGQLRQATAAEEEHDQQQDDQQLVGSYSHLRHPLRTLHRILLRVWT